MNEIYFDIIASSLQSMNTENEFAEVMSNGNFNWLFDKDLKKKKGQIMPGIGGILYNYVIPNDGDYMLNIQINRDTMKVKLGQLNTQTNKLNAVYSVECAIGTVGERMVDRAVPIDKFADYLAFAIDLKCKYMKDNNMIRLDNTQTEMASKLSKLKEFNINE